MTVYPWYIKWVFILLFFILTGFILYTGRPFLIPFSIGILLTFLLIPVSRWLEHHRIPKPAAIIISLLFMMILIGGLLFFLSSQFLSFSEEMPMFKSKLSEKFGVLQQFISDRFHVSEKRQVAWIEAQLFALLQSGGDIFGDIFSATGSFLAAATLIPIYIFFFSFYRHKFKDFVKYFFPHEQHDWIISIMHRTSLVSQKYLTGLIIDIAILAVLNSVGFLLLGINHAILLGVIAGLLNIIPYIGVLIGSILPILIALITKDSEWYAVGALGVCVFVQFLDNNFITPNVVGSAVSINPLATMIALLVGGMLWGLAGMMLFIPYLGMLKVIFDHVDSLKPFGYLIGEEAKMKSDRKKVLK
jgi:predicted PurR-regulated permease PerM